MMAYLTDYPTLMEYRNAMSSSNAYQSGPGAYNVENPTVLPNTFDGVMTADGGCSHFSPADRVSFVGRVAGTLTLTVTGSVANGDIIDVTVTNATLPNGAVTVTANALTSDTTTDVAQEIASAINNNSVLQQFDIYANSYKNVVHYNQLGPVSALSVVTAVVATGSETVVVSNDGVPQNGAGLAVPLNNFDVMINGACLRMRYFIPVQLSYSQLAAAAAAGPIK
jgi:hypothetical protein